MINLSAIDIQISGMTCSGCADRVENVLSAVNGVDLVSVYLVTKKVHIIAKSGERLNLNYLYQ